MKDRWQRPLALALFAAVVFLLFGGLDALRDVRITSAPDHLTREVRARRLTGNGVEYQLKAELSRDPRERGAWMIERLHFRNGGFVTFRNDTAGGERLRRGKWNLIGDDKGESWQIMLPDRPGEL